MNFIRAIKDWSRERAIKRHWRDASAAYKRKDRDAGNKHARMAMAEMKARSPEQVDRLNKLDADNLRKCRGK